MNYEILSICKFQEGLKLKTEYMMNYVDKYSNCISLGGNCSVACSLSKLGLRNASGPFDWYVSDFSSVLAQIENEFQDFMKRENLEIDIDNPKIFRDKNMILFVSMI